MTQRRRGNPALRNEVFTRVQPVAASEAMTLGGVVAKTMILIALTIASAGFTWWRIFQPLPAGARPNVLGLVLLAWVIGFALAVITIWKPALSATTAPIYAVVKGVMVGGISGLYNARYRGLPLEAVGLTIGTAVVMLILYEARVIRGTARVRGAIVTATCAIALLYLLDLGLWLFGGAPLPFIHQAGVFGIGFSVVVCGIAASNLILDFDLVEQGVTHGAPRYMEWYGGFAILVTLVWLYFELLRLLSKLNRR